MRISISHLVFGLVSPVALFAAVACAGSSDSSPNAKEPGEKQTLIAREPCGAASCGSVPSSLSGEPKVVCSDEQGDQCSWSDDPNDTSVSYRFCDSTECSPPPPKDCPEGTTFGGQQCGSTNDGPCLWTTSCVPPRETTPCPDPTGCDGIPQQAIGIICKDGSTGAFVCVTDGNQCYWERNCD